MDRNERKMMVICFSAGRDTRFPATLKMTDICNRFEPCPKNKFRSPHEEDMIRHEVGCALHRLQLRGYIIISETNPEFVTIQVTALGYDAGRWLSGFGGFISATWEISKQGLKAAIAVIEAFTRRPL